MSGANGTARGALTNTPSAASAASYTAELLFGLSPLRNSGVTAMSSSCTRGTASRTRQWRAVIVDGYGQYAGDSGLVRETNLRDAERMTAVLYTP